MMNKRINDLLCSLAIVGSYDFGSYYEYDKKINDCLMDMYFYMLYNGIGNEEKKAEYFQEFENKYDKLDKKQQEIVKQEYIDIIETQNKNREKVKKKGMNDYE